MSDLLQNVPNIVRLTLEDLGNDAEPIEKYIEQLQQRVRELEQELSTTVERLREAWVKGYQYSSNSYNGENTEYLSILKLAKQRYPDKDGE